VEGREIVVEVPQLAWPGDIDAELTFPSSWSVSVAQMKDHDAPMLSDEGFRKAFANPIGTKPIRELARGKKNVVIVFDDMARPNSRQALEAGQPIAPGKEVYLTDALPRPARHGVACPHGENKPDEKVGGDLDHSQGRLWQ
jgi:hypothetical protein